MHDATPTNADTTDEKTLASPEDARRRDPNADRVREKEAMTLWQLILMLAIELAALATALFIVAISNPVVG